MLRLQAETGLNRLLFFNKEEKKMGYYISDRANLAAEIRARKPVKEKLAMRVNAFAKKEFGIKDFTGISEQNLYLSPNRVHGVLCRQVATARIEEICSTLACDHFGLSPVNFTFGTDAFSSRNADKVNLVKVRFAVSHAENGQPIIRIDKIADPRILESMVLREIVVSDGLRLPEYHQRLRTKTFGERCPATRDIGALFSLYLRRAKKRPPYVFEINGLRAQKKPLEEANLYASRPPASWYYPLYLANFIQGNLVLFETYENMNGDVHKIKEEFRSAMDMVMDATGVYPMVVQTPALNLEMMTVNTALFASDWRKNIVIPENFSGDTVSLFELIARQAIAIDKNGL